MAIHTEEKTEITGGFDKQIDKGAMGLMLDILQKFQYQYPIKSAIRELVSNGLDSIRERDMARSILTGESKVEDHYLERDGEIYRDSHFKPEYYDLKWLDTNQNEVEICYTEGNGVQKDFVTISDNGVGLGDTRLQKYFSLGYSTKRLNKKALGKFGIGNKSPLAIMPYYTVESRYNGRLFRFNVFAAKVESLIPKFNLETEQSNGVQVFKNDDGSEYPVYYLQTEQSNGVTITIEAKKHHRQQYIDAVKSQLLYFDNLKMIVHHEDGNVENVAYKANILYEDEFIVLSDNSYWAKPHMLINKVNYGFVNFEELELESKAGNIGIKVEDTEVTLNPSREGVIWDEQTKATILQRFQDVVKVASNFVQNELHENDIIHWLRICFQISSRYIAGGTSIIRRLAQIVDISQIEPTFSGDSRIQFKGSNTVDGLDIRLVTITTTKEYGKTVKKLTREDAGYKIGVYSHLPFVLQDSRSLPRKDKYLLANVHRDGFLRVSPPFWLSSTYENNLDEEEFFKRLMGYLGSSNIESARSWYHKNQEKTEAMWAALQKSAEGQTHYEDIEVPEDFVASNLDEDEEEIYETEEVARETKLTHEERRKMQGKTIVHILNDYPSSRIDNQPYGFTKIEVPIVEINNWKEPEIYYGNDSDKELLLTATLFCEDTLDRHLYSFDNSDIRIVKIAQNNTKMYRDFKHISRFFFDVQNNIVTMSNKLIQWNTARRMTDGIQSLAFLYNFSPNPEKQDRFRRLYDYYKAHFKNIEVKNDASIQVMSQEAFDSMLRHITIVETFQKFVATCDDPEQVATMAKNLWGSETITDAAAIDMSIWNEFTDLLEWALPIQPFLNAIPDLTGFWDNDANNYFDPKEDKLEKVEHQERKPSTEFLQELDSYLHWKGVL